MTDEEIDEILQLMKTDPLGAGPKAMLKLSPEERQAVVARATSLSDQAIRKQFQEMKADGTLEKLEEMIAQDKAKRKRRP
jgi:hypothetical protein